MEPRTLPAKTLQSASLPGQDVLIATVQISANPIVYEISATIGTHIYTERHTIGAMGGGPLLTAARLQADLDGYRQQVADRAAWQVAMSGPQAQVT